MRHVTFRSFAIAGTAPVKLGSHAPGKDAGAILQAEELGRNWKDRSTLTDPCTHRSAEGFVIRVLIHIEIRNVKVETDAS